MQNWELKLSQCALRWRWAGHRQQACIWQQNQCWVQLLPFSMKSPLGETHWQPQCRNSSGVRYASSLASLLQSDLCHRENLGLQPGGKHNPSSFANCRVGSSSRHFRHQTAATWDHFAQTMGTYVQMAPGLGSCWADTFYKSVVDLQTLNISILIKIIILWIESSFIFLQVIPILADLWISFWETQTGLEILSAEYLA